LAPFSRHHLGLRDHRHGLEVEAGERLSGGQPRLGQVTLDAPSATVGDLLLCKCGQEARGRPALFVGLCGDLGPGCFDAGQTQLGQHQFQAGGVDGCRAGHAATSMLARSTINRGEDDLDVGPLGEGRQRRPGGGGKPLAERDATLVCDLQKLVEPVIPPSSRSRRSAYGPCGWGGRAIRT
jgi:hypothetical protein